MERYHWEEMVSRYEKAHKNGRPHAERSAAENFLSALADKRWYPISENEIESAVDTTRVYGGLVPQLIQRAMQKAMERT